MSGSEQAKAKENAAAIMRAKQLAGKSPPLTPISFSTPCVVVLSRRVCMHLWAVLISRAAEAKKAEAGAGK